MKPTIVVIIGESGAGKTTAAEYLQKELKWHNIVSYTTRPMRQGETDGREHYFVDGNDMPARESMCAYTFFGGHHYWTTWKQLMGYDVYVYVIDEKGLMELLKDSAVANYNIVSIHIKRTLKTGIEQARIDRDKERINIPDYRYDYVVVNDDTIETFQKELKYVGTIILQNNGNTK